MAVILLFMAIFLTIFAIYKRSNNFSTSLIWASLMIGLAISASTEILSLFHVFNREWLTLFWLAYSITLIISQKLWRSFPPLPAFPRHYMMIPVIIFLGLTLLNALISPPNTYDSLTYHMTRISYWEQNGTVNHFSTNEPRNLYQHPFAEYTIAHFQFLSSTDQFANLPQWFSYSLSLLLVFTIAGQLGASQHQKWLALLFAMTIPMGIIQATSTQNDLVTSFGVLASIYFSLELRKKITVLLLIGLGVSVGLALLTKGTSYVYLLPVLVWLSLTLFLKENFRAIYKLAIAGSISIALFMPHLLRNYSTFDSFTGPHSELYMNQTISPAQLTSNILRNLALHFSTPFRANITMEISKSINDVVIGIHDVLGISINDPDFTWFSTSYPVLSTVKYGDDAASAFFHVPMIILALIAVIFARKWSLLAQYSLICVSMFVIFALLLKWQPWHTRLHMPMLLASMPIIVLALNKRVVYVGIILAILMGIFWVLSTPKRSFIGEQSILRTPRNTLYLMGDDYLAISEIAITQNCPIGLYLITDSSEYLFHVALKQKSFTGELPQVGSVFSEWLNDPSYQPCLIISNMNLPETVKMEWEVWNQTFSNPVLSNSPYKIYVPSTPFWGDESVNYLFNSQRQSYIIEESGWNNYEVSPGNTFRWTSEPVARFVLNAEGANFDAQKNYTVTIRVVSSLEEEVLNSLQLTLNDQIIDLIQDGNNFSGVVAGATLAEDRLEVVFQTTRVSNPFDLGIQDGRKLGVALSELTIAPLTDDE